MKKLSGEGQPLDIRRQFFHVGMKELLKTAHTLLCKYFPILFITVLSNLDKI